MTFISAILIVFFLGKMAAGKAGLDRKEYVYFFLTLVIGGAIGGRVFNALFWHPSMTLAQKALFAVDLSRPGIASSGFIIGITASAYLYCRIRRIDLWKYLDIIAPYLGLGLAIGRIGCFLAGCCYGKPAPEWLPFALEHDGLLQHPTQLYDMANGLLVFFIVMYAKTKKHLDGFLVLLAAIIYSLVRAIVVETFRADSESFIMWMSVNQISYMVFAAVAAGIMAFRWVRWKKLKNKKA